MLLALKVVKNVCPPNLSLKNSLRLLHGMKKTYAQTKSGIITRRETQPHWQRDLHEKTAALPHEK
jgi:hypothetical protein